MLQLPVVQVYDRQNFESSRLSGISGPDNSSTVLSLASLMLRLIQCYRAVISMSFKRKGTASRSNISSATRSSPSSSSVRNVSSGIPSLDDILGGGIPLSSNLLILTSDPHAAYGDVIQKYFIAQGIASSQHVCVISDPGRGIDFVRQCMWLLNSQALSNTEDKNDDHDKPTRSNHTKIAWRYENLGNFKTTIESSNSDESVYRLDLFEGYLPNLVKIIVKALTSQLEFRNQLSTTH